MDNPPTTPEPGEGDERLLCLADFELNNPLSSIKAHEKGIVINRPWDDNTIALQVPWDDVELHDALNGVLLPPVFTAIYHLAERSLEFIYTAHPISEEFRGRSFAFHLLGREYPCDFAPASQVLQKLAQTFIPNGPSSETNYRNLSSFVMQRLYKDRHPEDEGAYDPYSFWIREVDWNEDDLVSLARHINFFMIYFDKESPQIIVHEEDRKSEIVEPPKRYRLESFPDRINGRTVDPYLLGLWEASQKSQDTFRRFIFSYQVLEYVAFYYLKEELFQSLMRIVRSPEALANPEETVRLIQDTMTHEKLTDDQKMDALFRSVVDNVRLWNEIEPNLDHFNHDVVFDGGFSLGALVPENATFASFESAGCSEFGKSVKNLRNALVHSRESRQSASVAPTQANYERLRPWIPPLQYVAFEAILSL